MIPFTKKNIGKVVSEQTFFLIFITNVIIEKNIHSIHHFLHQPINTNMVIGLTKKKEMLSLI